MTIEELKAKVAELEMKLAVALQEARVAYTKGMQAAREFDEEMDTFMLKFYKKPYSSVVTFAVVAALMCASGYLGSLIG